MEIRIHGSSDDLIDVYGVSADYMQKSDNISNFTSAQDSGVEINCYSDDSYKGTLVFRNDNGASLWVHCYFYGAWCFAPAQKFHFDDGDANNFPNWDVKVVSSKNCQYSTEVVIFAPEDTRLVAFQPILTED